MLTPIQEIMLTCLLVNPDPRAFRRFCQRAQKRAAYVDNPCKFRTRNEKWKGENPEKFTQTHRICKYNLRQRDPEHRASINLRRRMRGALAGKNKSAPTMELLGCTIPELRAHLEAKFKPGMTWENYGPVWHIDHIRPCAKFNLLDPDQQRECFNFKNLQPLFAEENLKKGSK